MWKDKWKPPWIQKRRNILNSFAFYSTQFVCLNNVYNSHKNYRGLFSNSDPSVSCWILKGGFKKIQIRMCCSWICPFYQVSFPHRAEKKLFSPRGNEGDEDSLWFCFSVCDLANKDGIFWMAYVSLFLHVGGGDCEHCAIVAESQRGDAGRVAVELAEALLVERVPDVHEAIWTTWWKDKTQGQSQCYPVLDSIKKTMLFFYMLSKTTNVNLRLNKKQLFP